MNSEFIGPINIGNPVESTIKELASKIIEKVVIIFNNYSRFLIYDFNLGSEYCFQACK